MVEIWKEPKKNALIKLGMYAIFFIFVFFILNSLQTLPPKEDIITNPLDDFKTKINYQYEINDILVKVTGHRKIVMYQDIEYEIDNIPIEIEEFIININPTKIAELIDLGTLESTNHINNSETYIVELKDFVFIINNEEIESIETIRITVYENDDSIIKVILDLTNYFEFESIIIFEPR